MGLANDYDTEPADEDVAGSDEGIDDEQYQWLQDQLAHIGQLRIEDEEEEEEWVDPSGGLLVNIFAACEEGDTDKLGLNLADLQQTEFSIDTPGPDGDTALHLACLYGHMGCVQALLAAGCKLDPINSEDGTSPLHDAAAGGYLDIVQLLLQQAGTAMVPLQDSDGDTALHNAARGGHLAVVQHLLQHGADPAALNGARKTAAAESEDPQVVTALVKAAQQRLQQLRDAAAAKGPLAAAAGGAQGEAAAEDSVAAAAAAAAAEGPQQQPEPRQPTGTG